MTCINLFHQWFETILRYANCQKLQKRYWKEFINLRNRYFQAYSVFLWYISIFLCFSVPFFTHFLSIVLVVGIFFRVSFVGFGLENMLQAFYHYCILEKSIKCCFWSDDGNLSQRTLFEPHFDIHTNCQIISFSINL